MSSVRVVVLLLLALVIGAGAVLIIEGNAGPVSLHVGGFPAQVNLSLQIVIALSFLGGALTAGIVAGAPRVDGPFFHVLVGSLFALVLCAVGAILEKRGAAGVASLAGLLLLIMATAYERRINIANAAGALRTGLRGMWGGSSAALAATHTELTNWVQGLTHNPPVIAPPPPSGIVMLFVILLVPVVMGSTILVRAALVLALAAAGIVAVLRALTLVRLGQPIELRARSGGLAGGQGGWRLSQSGSLLLIAAVVLGAAVGLAQVDRRTEPQPAAETAPKKEATGREEPGKAGQTSASGSGPAAAEL